MHTIELLLHRFLNTVARGSHSIPDAILAKFSESTAAHLKQQFEREPRDFTLRMSNLGKPLCQLECEQAGIKGISWDNNMITRSTFGYICEDVLMFMLHAAGVPIVAEQESVELEIAGQRIKGTLDLVIDLGSIDFTIVPGGHIKLSDPRVWDIKSASDWTFRNKFTLPFDRFLDEDSFGYCDQLFLYSAAKGYPVGGIIVQNKATGEILVMEFPQEQQLYREAAIRRAEAKVAVLARKSRNVSLSNPMSAEQIPDIFSQELPHYPVPTTKYEPELESFRGKHTGNLILNSKCTFCDYKFHCYPSLQLKPKAKSVAKSPQLQYYVEYHDA